MGTKSPAPKPWVSGFCNPTLPRTTAYDPHQRCHGCDCRAPGCPCNPKTPQETPMPAEQPPSDQGPNHATPQVSLGEQDKTPENAVASIRAAADALNTALLAYAPGHWHDAARLLDALRQTTTRLAALDASLVQWLYLHGEHGLHQQVDGISGPVNITRGRSRERWAAPEAISEYVDRKMGALEGEIPDPAEVVSWVLEVLPATQSSSLRKTPLRAVGMDLDDFYWSEPGSLQVGLPKPPLA